MKDFLDDIEEEEIYFEVATELPDSPLRSIEEECLFQFKKVLFKHTRLLSNKNRDNDLYDESYWFSQITSVIPSDSDLIVCKDGRRLQEYIIDCLIDYLNRGINAESTPAFLIYYLLPELGLSFNENEELKVIQYEEMYNEFCHRRK